ncbi:MAG TPA: tRNA pseudouridine(38-40) synthase TruA [Methylomirabilota bacterium]|nr:tRNA pseudouridine(38-40) synthase TruA [Methylomirabilota bacterium]
MKAAGRDDAAPEANRYKMVVAYDGTNYKGWQVQKSGVGVQELVEKALAALFPSNPQLHSSSRTDTGVHALGMAAHFDVLATEDRMEPSKLLLALNAHLPEDVRIASVARARRNFHARFNSAGKQYRYFVWNHSAMNPLLRSQAWHVPKALDLAAMKRAAAHLVGKHDFGSFAANRGHPPLTTVRTVRRCDVGKSGSLITFTFEANGFLYKMCRGFAGTLVQVGLGKFNADEIPRILEKRDRRVAGMTAPAHGLVLWKVFYTPGAKPKPGAEEDEE